MGTGLAYSASPRNIIPPIFRRTLSVPIPVLYRLSLLNLLAFMNIVTGNNGKSIWVLHEGPPLLVPSEMVISDLSASFAAFIIPLRMSSLYSIFSGSGSRP